MKETLQLVLQCGALGLLAALFYGVFRIAIVYAPLVKEFIVGLIATQNVILQQSSATMAKVDAWQAANAAGHASIAKAVDSQASITSKLIEAIHEEGTETRSALDAAERRIVKVVWRELDSEPPRSSVPHAPPSGMGAAPQPRGA